MNAQEKFNIIKDVKTKLKQELIRLHEAYYYKIINYLKGLKICIDYNLIKKEKTVFSGVYLMYCEIDNEIIFTYVGESIDLFKRFRQHVANLNTTKKKYKKMRSLGASEKNIKFLILTFESDQNKRLLLETYYIYILRSKIYNLNTKLLSKKAKCDQNHGNMTSKLLNVNKLSIKLNVFVKCRNKLCKQIINLYDFNGLLYNRI
ncbi:GIY-YIG nuclease family protein [Spiroplasma turonicum]|uniref:GIY-YIG domain-containing protein n=1 Tax=Spiroplasma turonicum TaxID=216946 RepID=A0A0K1P7K7_9MOLU|nr:GIY-YIG nuclease family protein [Spiroplasma turonicum]AKU80278.1 hypothetical protein STURON_001032 [Spiroplasma turonicum]ALX71279.1 hypothetical protein STURO_v1c10280 [Spiroplasma turonicum]